jgi:hypothetical protein
MDSIWLWTVAGAYFALWATGALLTQSLRIRLAILVNDMLKEERWTKAERAHLRSMVETSMSTAVGARVPLAAISVFIDVALGLRLDRGVPASNVRSDPRYRGPLSLWYMLSILATNPIATLLSLPFAVMTLIVMKYRGRARFASIAEAPVMRAVSGLRHA